MRVLFEKDGWQLRQLSIETDSVYVVHKRCVPYAYYLDPFTCHSCKALAPDSIQALSILYNGNAI